MFVGLGLFLFLVANSSTAVFVPSALFLPVYLVICLPACYYALNYSPVSRTMPRLLQDPLSAVFSCT